MTLTHESYQDVLNMSYGFFRGRICTPAELQGFLDLMKPKLDEAGVSYDQAFEDLERRHTIALLDSSYILEDHGDHEEWFNVSTNNGLKRSIDWHFWRHFEAYLTSGKNWPKGIVENIDRESGTILSKLEDPLRTGSWDRRGMVMGSVQSGKTANYTGLICKAIDAGYKLLVVLAGVHNSLRSQTQYRLNEEVLGYDMDKVQVFQGQAARIGVRAMFSNHKIAQTLTSSSEAGDFKKSLAEQAGIIPTADGPAIIMVVKKNVSILRNLTDWATSIIGQPDDSGRRVVTDVPLLVIDDECDYASVNTKKVVLDENGLVDEDCDPAKTNQRIRELLNSFNKSAYVGYTATPFANIFIHHGLKHAVHGEDLFPRNFIISLPEPTNYVGPERVFGLVENRSAGINAEGPSMLVHYVTDSDELIPPRHRKDLEVYQLPTSLEEAIRAFLISCAVRHIRQCSPPHDSMLVHVTRFNKVQTKIQTLVEHSLRKYVARILSGTDPLDDFRSLWESDFIPTTELLHNEPGATVSSWEEVVEHLYPVVRRIHVRLINGTSSDMLAYRNAEMVTRQKTEQGEDVPWEERGEHIIAIGGDKLSRGLTLDGLTVSYYLRASKMYDTLMQMGRWFGYRDGYLDLCRIYTTEELAGWYQFISSASLELREELNYMALIGAEPKDFGLKVLDHPGQLAITAAGKRRNAETLDLSYSGRISETVLFDLRYSAENLSALAQLLNVIELEGDRQTKAPRGILHWKNVGPEAITRYMRGYQTPESARLVDPGKIAQFIEQQRSQSLEDLITWDVAVISLQEGKFHSLKMDGFEINCLQRKPRTFDGTIMTLGRLVNPSDEWIDFNEDEKNAAKSYWEELRSAKQLTTPAENDIPSGPTIRAIRPKQRGLLLIYPICYKGPDFGTYGLDDGQEVTGFAVSFPASKTTREVRYVVNSVFQDAED